MSSTEFAIDSISYLVGESYIETSPIEPYSAPTCSFLAELSSQLLSMSSMRQYPDVASFAYWCRRKNIESKRSKAQQDPLFSKRMGRGLAFHVAPSNVPVNFAFSYVFSLLAGNANIVRVPTRSYPQVNMICAALREVLGNYPEIASRTMFVSYKADDDITATFSAAADLRIIWGGDETVSHIRTLPHKIRCSDTVFSDRYSIAFLDGLAIEALSKTELTALADAFYNDTYLMDQNACSSPQTVFWLNAKENAKTLFWNAVRKTVSERYEMQPVLAVDKYVELCRLAIDDVGVVIPLFDGLLTVVPLNLNRFSDSLSSMRGIGGLFFECDIPSPDKASCFVTEKFQTASYFGCDPFAIDKMIRAQGLRGIDRIVPIGQAMDIDVIWDGFDLVCAFSRIIDVR